MTFKKSFSDRQTMNRHSGVVKGSENKGNQKSRNITMETVWA